MKDGKDSELDWIDLLLIVALMISSVMTLLSFFPTLWRSRLMWLSVNLAVVVALVAIRVAPEARQALAARRAEVARRRRREEHKRQAAEREARRSRRIGR